MKSWGLSKTLVILSLALLLTPRTSAQQLERTVTGKPVAPITVHNPKNLAWPANLAQKVYFEACAATAQELNPAHPKDLHPAITVELGADGNTVETGTHSGQTYSTIRLKKWDEALFAYAVVTAARDTSIDQRAAEVIAHRVVVMVESEKTVQQEKEQQ